MNFLNDIYGQDFRSNLVNLFDFYNSIKYKSINKAAEVNHVYQSTISRSIKRLEKKYNVKLLISNNKGIALTNEGMILYDSLVKIFN